MQRRRKRERERQGQRPRDQVANLLESQNANQVLQQSYSWVPYISGKNMFTLKTCTGMFSGFINYPCVLQRMNE